MTILRHSEFCTFVNKQWENVHLDTKVWSKQDIFVSIKLVKISHNELKIQGFEQESKGNKNISFGSELSFGFMFDFFKYQQKIIWDMYRPNLTLAERVTYKFLGNLKCFYN